MKKINNFFKSIYYIGILILIFFQLFGIVIFEGFSSWKRRRNNYE